MSMRLESLPPEQLAPAAADVAALQDDPRFAGG